MKERVIYTIPSLYRDDLRIRAYTFGAGEKALCFVGPSRGNEYQQLFICSQLIQRLKQYEKEKRLVRGKEIMVIPSINPSSMNIGKRFWPIDNTDINRMFPGYDLGETTQRIAAGVFEVVNKYQNGIQFTSFYMPGDFSEHVRMMHTGLENIEKAKQFGLPYIIIRNPKPYDTTTLNYNWQIWDTDAFSLYSTTTDHIDPKSAQDMLDGIERFMILNGLLKGEAKDVAETRVVYYEELLNIRTSRAGLYRNFLESNSHVEKGQLCAKVYDAYSGETIERLYAPEDGIVFFQHSDPLVYASTSVIKLLPDLKENSAKESESE